MDNSLNGTELVLELAKGIIFPETKLKKFLSQYEKM